MKNKRGFLLAEETLKIIIAAICIGFLVYFLAALYFNNKNSEELEQAKASLEFLVKEINEGREEVMIYNPSPTWNAGFFVGWKITSWSFPEMPNSCLNLGWENCLCICKTGTGPKKEECDKKGICLQSKDKITLKKGICEHDGRNCHIEIKDLPLTLNINYEDRTITRIN